MKVKLSIGNYQTNFLCEVVPKETCHVLLRQPLQSIKIFINNGCINETTFTHKRKTLNKGELMGQNRVDKTLELLKGKLLSPMRKEVQRHYLRYISCFTNTPKAMSHELYTPLPFANDLWEDINLDFILELPRTTKGFSMDMDKLFSREVISLHGLSSSIVILPVDRSAGECLVKGSACAPLLTSVPPLDLSQEPAKKRHGAAAVDRTPTLKSVTVSPNTKNWNRANSLSQTALSLASVKCMN